jgi:thiol:disulfide interchange protein DsbD
MFRWTKSFLPRGLLRNLLVGIILLLSSGSAHAGLTAEDESKPDAIVAKDPVTIGLFASRLEVSPGESFQLLLRLTIDDEWHINSSAPIQEYLIPTTVNLDDDSNFMVREISYPAGKRRAFAFSPDEPLSVYGGVVWIKMLLASSTGANVGTAPLRVSVTTQACNDRMCLAPATQILSFPMKVNPDAAIAGIRHAALFESHGIDDMTTLPAAAGERPGSSGDLPDAGSMGFWAMLQDFDASAFVNRYGYILAFIAMYILGLGLTLTPCVYPIIPITIGFFGAQSGGRWTRQLLVASVFGLGIAISYAAVGTAAAFSGSLMGAALQNIWVLITLATLCVVMGLNAFGVFELRLPGWFMNLAGGSSRKGIIGAAVMGLTMGIASAPCLAAFIISLLAFVGQKGDPILGFSMFLMLGLGLATPFVALGTFSGMVHKIPKSGEWLVFAKKLMGSLLFAAALYFLNTIIPGTIFNSIVLVSLVTAGLYFGFFEKTPVKTITFRAVRLTLGAIFLGVSLWWGMPAGEIATGPRISWQAYSETALVQAKESGRPVVIDFFADWCIPCKEMDRVSFSDQQVIQLSKDFVMLKADVTRGSSPEVKSLLKRYDIKGVPTIVFIGPDGRERDDLRIVQFEPASEFLLRFRELSSLQNE